MQIPRQIFSTCSKQQIGIEVLRRERQKLLRNNPAWSYSCLSDQDCETFLRDFYPGPTYQAWRMLNPGYGAAKADLIRYCLIYSLGGVYLDIKSSAHSALSRIIREDDEYLLGQWDNSPGDRHQNWGMHPQLSHIRGGEYQQWFIAGRRGHPFLKAVIDRVTRNILEYPRYSQYQYGRMSVLETTGPIAYTLAINSCIRQASEKSGLSYRLIKPHNEGLIYSIFEKKTYLVNPENTIGTTAGDTHLNHSYMENHYSRRTDPIVIKSDDKPDHPIDR